MKIMIAIPCYENPARDFVQCLLNLEKVDQTDIVFHGSSLIYDARNQLALKAIKEEYDYVLWLDADMIFKPTILKDLLATGKELVSGMCFSRRPPYRPCFFDKCNIEHLELNEVKPVVHNYYKYPKNQLFEVEGFGLGCALTTVEALKSVNDILGLPFSPMAGFGEDLSFCIKATSLGYQLFVDSRLKIGHLGSIVVNEDLYQLQQKSGRGAKDVQ